MNFEKLKEKEYNKDLYDCTTCGQCVSGPVDPWLPTADRVCPIYEKHRLKSRSGLGMINIARALLEGKLEPSDEIAEAIWECVLCENCFKTCDQSFVHLDAETKKRLGRSKGINAAKVVKAMRADLVKGGIEPPGLFKKTTTWIEKKHNRWNRRPEDRAKWLPEEIRPPKSGKMVYFSGCFNSYNSTKISQDFTIVLDKLGVDFAFLGEDEWCCGYPLLNSGLLEQFETTAKHNVDAIRNAGAEKVVTTCPECYNTLKNDYPEVVGGELGFEVIHSTQLLARLLDEGKIKFTKELKEKVVYQDPCQLSRTNKVYEEPRKLIESVPGIELVEMEGNKEFTLCCGGFPIELPKLSMKTSVDRIGDAQATGATTVITACPACKLSLNKAVKSMGTDMKVMDIVELVADVLS